MNQSSMVSSNSFFYNRQLNTIDLVDRKIPGLSYCNNLNNLLKFNNIQNVKCLILDISPNGLPLQDIQLNDINFDIIHLSLPTTLLKRSKFSFDKLLHATLNKDKLAKLLELIENCQIYLFIDESSQSHCCLKSTFLLIDKFIDYIKNNFVLMKKETILLSFNIFNSITPNTLNMSSIDNNYNNYNNNNNQQKIKQFNLNIKIPTINSKKLFIQSLKKDMINYSPNSLKKYFHFNIPSIIEKNDPILPMWLKFYSNHDNVFKILINLKEKFEILEDFELDRLSYCLLNENKHENKTDNIGSNTNIINNNKNNNSTNNSNDNNNKEPKQLNDFEFADLDSNKEFKNNNADIISFNNLNNFNNINEINNNDNNTESGNSENKNFTITINNVGKSQSNHKIYSLSHLQKLFNSKKKNENGSKLSISSSTPSALSSPSSLLPPIETTVIKTSIPSNLKDVTLRESSMSPRLKSSKSSLFVKTKYSTASNTSTGPPSTTSDSSNGDNLLTPLDNYELSQGIQSFSKNRYSNILPYEHSRVRLHKSPRLESFKETLTNNSLRNYTVGNNDNEIDLMDGYVNNDNIDSKNDNVNDYFLMCNSTTSSSTNNSPSRLTRNHSPTPLLNFNIPSNIPSATTSVVSPNAKNLRKRRISSFTKINELVIPMRNNKIDNINFDDLRIENNNTATINSGYTDYKLIPPMITRHDSDKRLKTNSSITNNHQSITISDGYAKENDKNLTTTLDGGSKESFNDYVNANYLSIPKINKKYRYVATQAPLPSTIDDFWNVVTSNNIKIIVSLNSDNELEMKKWDIYWNNNDKQKYKINVVDTINNICGVDGCILRIFQVSKRLKKKYYLIYQIQYIKWLDSSVINPHELLKIFNIKDSLRSDPLQFLKINADQLSETVDLTKVIKLHNACFNYKTLENHSETPLLIHCSAGCGRTGVFITLDFLINVFNEPQTNKIDVWEMKDDLLFIIINELRKQRLSMVQNLSQYIACYEFTLNYFAILKERLGTIKS